MGTISFLFTTDSHGKYIDWRDAEYVLKLKQRFKPDYTIHGGDFLDFGPLRSKATANEKAGDILEDIKEGKKWISLLKPDVITLGNHDDRIYGHLGALANRQDEDNERGRSKRSQTCLEEIGARSVVDDINATFKKAGTKVIPYGSGKGFNIGGVKYGDTTIGGIWFAHGNASGDGVCKAMSHQFLGNVMFGHVHTSDCITMQNIMRSFSQSVGSLCRDEDMDYQRIDTRYLKHERGVVVGLFDTVSKRCAYTVGKKLGDKWVCPIPEL